MCHEHWKEPAGGGVHRLQEAQHELFDGFDRPIVGVGQGNGTGAVDIPDPRRVAPQVIQISLDLLARRDQTRLLCHKRTPVSRATP